MKTIRLVLATVVCILLPAGFAASQWALLHGQAASYAAKIDVLPVRLLASAVLILAVVFQLIPDREEAE